MTSTTYVRTRKTPTRATGNTGESVAAKYLENKGFVVIERNYRKRWGEIDIICMKDSVLHFFEVKSVTVYMKGGHQPEDNVHGLKRKRIGRMIETYLEERQKLAHDFFFHVLCVYMDMGMRKARVRMLENVIL